MSEKLYYTMDNIGRAKYTINYHDGISTHRDGSAFYGIETFKNKKKYNARLKEMIKEGYKETRMSIYK